MYAQTPWPNDVVMEFLGHYKDEQMLWNPKHHDYKNKAVLQAAWERIQLAMSIECTISDLKKKKESVMTGYRVQVRKLKTIPNYKPTWFFFDYMNSFLGEIYMEEEFFCVEEALNDADEQNSFSEYTELRPIKKEKVQSVSSKRTPKRKKSEGASFSPSYSYAKKEETYPGELDECDLYAQLLAKKLRKLSERQRDIVMHEIDNILFRAKMDKDNFGSSYDSSNKSRRMKSSGSPVFISTDQNVYEAEYLEDPMPDS